MQKTLLEAQYDVYLKGKNQIPLNEHYMGINETLSMVLHMI
jgi:hypothetical protein